MSQSSHVSNDLPLASANQPQPPAQDALYNASNTQCSGEVTPVGDVASTTTENVERPPPKGSPMSSKPQFSGTESISTTHPSGPSLPDNHPALPPNEANASSSAQSSTSDSMMATSCTAEAMLRSPPQVNSEDSPTALEPFDLYIYGDHRSETPRLPTVRHALSVKPQHDPFVKPHGQVGKMPDHIIALPPLSSPDDSPLEMPSTPIQRPFDTLDNSTIQSGERLRYRSWREGKPVLGGRVMGVGDENGISAEGGGIEKKIEVALPRTDQNLNSRSRKASQVFGVFKGVESVKGCTKLDEVPEHHGVSTHRSKHGVHSGRDVAKDGKRICCF